MSYFDYYEGFDVIGEDTFKISPSRVSRFFDDTGNWYRECLLGEEPVFQGNTNSHLGTIVHGLAEMYLKTGTQDYSKAEEYIAALAMKGDPEIDIGYIQSQYQPMFEVLLSQYLFQFQDVRSEEFLHHFMKPGIAVAGTADLILEDRVVDFKTTSSLNAPDRVYRGYWFQQLCYVYMLRMAGMDIRHFELIYITHNSVGRISEKTGKPLKDYPATVNSVIHDVTDSDISIIESTLKLITESVSCWQSSPEMRHLLAQDMRLKEQINITFS